VTEKTAPFLHYPVQTVRQTDEGGVMLGDSQEEAGADPTVTTPVIAVLADRAVRMFPQIANLNIVRTWAALRVMTKDGFPVYDQSSSCPGAFSAACHSGVTLAAAHALVLAPRIAAGQLPEDFQAFSARRFDVQAAAA
jgi:glycine/D-amino acid oxidase-like deaminating enzyme